MRINAGACYCVYDNSGFLEESVWRIYPLVDQILFSVNFNPWTGDKRPELLANTLATIVNMPDPDKKFKIINGYWDNEADQRNAARASMHADNIDWCWIIDDDEFYNRDQAKYVLDFIQSAPNNVHIYTIPHKVYWKSKDWCFDSMGALPALVRCDSKFAYHNLNRAVIIRGFKHRFSPSNVVCHHMSYVRSDEKMKAKLEMWSHSAEVVPGWYENVWLKWHPDMINVAPVNPESIKKIVPATEIGPVLENIPNSLT